MANPPEPGATCTVIEFPKERIVRMVRAVDEQPLEVSASALLNVLARRRWVMELDDNFDLQLRTLPRDSAQ